MKKCNSQNGFTLIEVLIAIFLLTVGILGAAAMQIASIEGNSLAIRLTSAANWASDTHETLMALPYTDPDLTDDKGNIGFAGLNDTDTAGSLADGGPVFQGDYTVFWNVAEDYPILHCKTIRVIARYRTNATQIRTVTQDFTKMESI